MQIPRKIKTTRYTLCPTLYSSLSKRIPFEQPEVQLINIGDSLPQMTLKNETGEDVEVSSLAAEKGVILFLIPKADTRGALHSLFFPFYSR